MTRLRGMRGMTRLRGMRVRSTRIPKLKFLIWE